MAAGFGVFALAAVIILNNPWAGGQALILAMRRAPLPPGVSLTVSNAHGRLLNGLEMTGLKLSRGEAVLATVDTLRASYGWRRLFGKAIQIESVDITGAAVQLDSLLQAFNTPAATAGAGGRTTTGNRVPPLEVARFTLREGTLVTHPGGTADSLRLTLQHLAVDARALRLSTDPALVVERLTGTIAPGPAWPEGGTIDGQGRYGAGVLTFDRLRLTTPHSDLRAAGSLGVRGQPGAAPAGAQFTLTARPLGLVDLSPWVPGLGDSGQVALDARLGGATLDRLSGDVHVAGAGLRLYGTAVDRLDATARFEGGLDSLEIIADLTAPLPLPPKPRARPVTALFHFEGGVSLAAARLTGSLRSETEAGRVALDRIEATFGAAPTFRVGRGSIEHLDPHRLLRDATLPAADLNATFSAAGSFSAPFNAPPGGDALAALRGGGWLSADADITLAESHWEDVVLTSGRFHMATRGAGAELAGDLLIPAGRVDLDLRLDNLGPPLRYRVNAITLHDLDLARLPGAPGPSSALNLTLTGQGVGVEPRGMTFDGAITLAPSRLDSLALRAGRADLHLAGGRLGFSTELNTGFGTGTLRGALSPWLKPAPFELHARLPLDGLLRRFDRKGFVLRGLVDIDAVGSGLDPATLTAQGAFVARGRLNGTPIDSLGALFHVADRTAFLDTLHVNTGSFSAHGSGQVAFTDSLHARRSDLRLQLDTAFLAPLAALFGLDTLAADAGHAELRLTGDGRGYRLDASAQVAQLLAGTSRVGQASGQATLELSPGWRPLGGQGSARLDHARSAGFRADSLLATADYDGSTIGLDLRLVAPGGKGLTSTARFDPRVASRGLRLDALQLDGRGTRWTLERPATIALGADRISVDELLLHSAGGSLEAHGGLNRHGEQDLVIKLDAFQIGGAAALKGRTDLEGTLSGNIVVTGPAESPRLVADTELTLSGAQGALGHLVTKVESSAGHLVLDARLTQSSGAPLLVAGSVPLRFSLVADTTRAFALLRPTGEPLDLRLSGTDVPLDFLAGFVDQLSVEPIDGRLSIDARVTGTLKAPAGRGTLTLDVPQLRLPAFGVTYRELRVAAALDTGTLALTSVTAKSGSGQFKGTGLVRPGARGYPEYRLTGTLDRFRAVTTRDWNATLSGELTLAGAADSLHASGRLTPNELEYFFTPVAQVDAADVELTEADYRLLERSFGQDFRGVQTDQGLWSGLGLDLEMTFNRNAWYRQRGEPRLAVELTGNVRVFKAVRGPLLLYGHVEPIAGRGYVDQLGRRFDIKSGEIDLNGDILATQLRVNTEYKTPPSQDSGQSPVTVTLDVTGRPDQLKLEFSSEPAMTQSEILATIVNGTAGGTNVAAVAQGGGETAGAAVQVGLSRLTGAVEEAAQRNIGLDVVQIRQDGLRGATLVAGKYLYPRLYFGIRQPVSFESRSADATENSPRSQFEAEYSAYPWLLLNAQGEGSRVQFMLRGRYAF